MRQRCVVPEAMSVVTLFRRCSMRTKGGNGFTSASESAISAACMSSPVVAQAEEGDNGPSPKTILSFDLIVSPTARAATGTSVDSESAAASGCRERTMALARRRARARRYVRLRSGRNVSRKKNVKRTRSIPRRAASNQNAARQLNACVRTPPSSGPSEGPRSGAA